MSIYVTQGVNRKRTAAQIVDYCANEGIEDAKYGIPFEIITLEWIAKHRRISANYRMHGFEDTHISLDESQNVVISHPDDRGSPIGALTWMKAEFGNRYVAKLQKTPWNMKMLVSHYMDGIFKIKNKEVDAEVAAAAKNRYEAMTQEDREEYDAMRMGQRRDKAGNRMDRAGDELEKLEAQIEAKKKELFELSTVAPAPIAPKQAKKAKVETKKLKAIIEEPEAPDPEDEIDPPDPEDELEPITG